MEKVDHELINSLIPTNPSLKKLYSEHHKLEKLVFRFENYAHYSATAALKHQEYKKAKLRGVDSMMKIIAPYKIAKAA